MSLLQAIKEAKAVVSSLEALLGTEQVGLWYLNIPAEGVLCYVDDDAGICSADAGRSSSFKRLVKEFDYVRGFVAHPTAGDLEIDICGTRLQIAY